MKKINIHTFYDSTYDNEDQLIDYICDIKGILKTSQKFFKSYKQEWKVAANKYIRKKANSHKLPVPLHVVNNKHALINLYENEPAALKPYLRELKKKQSSNCCCYCGCLLANSTDHYLPKNQYPQFSVLKHNFIPICTTCNSAKLEFVGIKNKRVINPIFDEFIDDIKLEVDFIFDNGAVDYKIKLVRTIENQWLHDLVEFHYEKLVADNINYFVHFKEQFEYYVDKYVNENVYETVYDLFKEWKAEEEKDTRKYGTSNNWNSIFYRSMRKKLGPIKYLKYLKANNGRLDYKNFKTLYTSARFFN